MTRGEIVIGARDSIEKGSKSFRAASRLFDRRTRERAWMLYCWCRHCDDVCDGQTFGFGHGESGSVTALRDSTRAALAGQPSDEIPFLALSQLNTECPIPQQLVDDHLEGFVLDEAGWRPKTEADLVRYCYHVAGAVGCMMAIIMGVAADDDKTLKAAADLGIAFQLSNIARDVREDAEAGRCYLPSDWLDEYGVTVETLFVPANSAALETMIGRLIDRVEAYEEGARKGVPRLPFRSRMAVLSAVGSPGTELEFAL